MAPPTNYRDLRDSLGLTLREIARRTGINPGRLSTIERGLTPTDAEHAAIMAALTREPVGIRPAAPKGLTR